MKETIKDILMKRDNMSAEDADDLIHEAACDLQLRLEEGDISGAEEICSDYFGLEPDYIFELF